MYTTDQAIEAVRHMGFAIMDATKALNLRRGTVGAAWRERKAIACVLHLLLDRTPTEEELNHCIPG